MSVSSRPSSPVEPQRSFKDWPWEGFDVDQNNEDIGRFTFPQLGAKYDDAGLDFDWEAPVAIEGSGERYRGAPKDRKNHLSGTLWVKWYDYCPCFNSEANLEETSDPNVLQAVQKINVYLARAGYKDSHALAQGQTVYFSDTFITSWRQDFYKSHPDLAFWKSNRVRRDRGTDQCNCPPPVRDHPELPPYRSPDGWVIRTPGPEYDAARYFWRDPEAPDSDSGSELGSDMETEG